MKNLSFENTHGPFEDKFLKALEQSWGFYLPNDYRYFILEHNGGRPEPRYYNFKEQLVGSDVHTFFGIYKDPNYNLLCKLRDMGSRIPCDCFPVACDSCGNLICIVIKGSDRGKIYFWDHELEAADGEEPSYDNLTLIADSFDEFLNSLHDLDK